MPFAFVSGAENSGASGTSVAVTKSVTAGNLLVYLVNIQTGSTLPVSTWLSSVTDGANTYAPATPGSAGYFAAGNGNYGGWMGYCLSLASTASLTVTANFTGTSGVSFSSIMIAEYSGAGAFDVAGAMAVQVNAAATTNAATSGTAAVTTGDLVIGLALDVTSHGFNAGTGFTLDFHDAGSPISWGCESLTQGSGATRGATVTPLSGTNVYSTGMLAFLAPAAGGPSFSTTYHWNLGVSV